MKHTTVFPQKSDLDGQSALMRLTEQNSTQDPVVESYMNLCSTSRTRADLQAGLIFGETRYLDRVQEPLMVSFNLLCRCSPVTTAFHKRAERQLF